MFTVTIRLGDRAKVRTEVRTEVRLISKSGDELELQPGVV